uniref:Uncharacterized protein n=1 Tax=Mucochytrium quahogii TaxID=96639 RepID=A0A7S2WNV8_9STRA|mmetsp:Transcript_30066/g.47785  ORF Transcript_30066/g.47785 Transcript_30066/m.47785 type:complete len:407 (-) Transcript_30066:752-1972(-)
MVPDTLTFVDADHAGDRFLGKNVVLIGGSSGMGFATGTQMVQECAKTVFIVCRNTVQGKVAVDILETLAAEQEQCGDNTSKVVLVKADVEDRAQVKKMYKTVGDITPRVDIVVNCAGIGGYMGPGIGGVPDKFVFSKFDPILNNLYGNLYVSTEAVRFWNISDDGPSGLDYTPVLINYASANSLEPCPGCDMYSASKGGIMMLTASIAKKYQGKMRTHAILPGLVDTPLTWNQVRGMKIAQNGSVVRAEPLQAFQCYSEVDSRVIEDGTCPSGGTGLGCPCEDIARSDPRVEKYFSSLGMWPPVSPLKVAKVTLLLASDEASHLNGKTYVVDTNFTDDIATQKVRDCPLTTQESCPLLPYSEILGAEKASYGMVMMPFDIFSFLSGFLFCMLISNMFSIRLKSFRQ